MSEQDEKIVNLGRLKKFKEYYDTDIITPINNKIDSKTNVQSGEIITTNNDTIGYFKNIKINGNTHYKKSDGTYTDTWESGVSLESMGEKEKNSNGKYPIIIKSSNDTKEDKRTVLLDSPLRKVGTIADVLDLKEMKVTRKTKSITIDGTITNWVQAKIGDNSILWYIILSDAIPSAPSMCDKLKKDDTLWEHDISGAYRIDESKAFQIRTDKTISTLSALTTWLQSNPVTVAYQLATPITEDIDVSSNTLTDFATSCTLTIDNTIKGNIECNEVVGLIPSVEENGTRLANVEKSLENKAEKNHNHDNNYLKLSGGTMTGNITLPKGKTISTTTSGGNTLLEETDSNVNIGFSTKGVNLNCSAGYINGSMILTKGNSNYAEVLFMGTTGGTTRKNVNSCMKITTSSDKYYPVFTAPSDGVYLFMAWGSVSNAVLAVNQQELCSNNQQSGVKPIYLSKSDEASFYIWFSGNANSGLSSGIDIVVMRIN